LDSDLGPADVPGQQVTCYPHNDTNNHWQVLPTKPIPDTGRGRVVRHHDIIQLKHINTQTILLTHDVASPLMPTNQEFTTVSPDDEDRYNDTLFQVDVIDAHEGEPWKSLAGHFKLIHIPTRVLLWTHPGPLPEWAYGQQEVNGKKDSGDRTTHWFVDDIVADGTGNDFRNRTVHVEPKAIKSRSFIKKFAELQILMLQHNAGLTASHPYASSPMEWPFCLSGVSFWTDGATNQQIYMIGNLLDWWICAVAVSVFVGIIGADMLARRRGLDPIEDSERPRYDLYDGFFADHTRLGIRNRLYRNTFFFLGAWLFHYLPFYLMSRQKFLHHYLPAHLASALVAGSVLNFILVETVNYPVSVPGQRTRLRPAVRAKMGKIAWIVTAVLLLVVVGCFLWLAPLTYAQT
jgi:dolichyl-phosphate-mannose-protein mannosyltransferase